MIPKHRRPQFPLSLAIVGSDLIGKQMIAELLSRAGERHGQEIDVVVIESTGSPEETTQLLKDLAKGDRSVIVVNEESRPRFDPVAALKELTYEKVSLDDLMFTIRSQPSLKTTGAPEYAQPFYMGIKSVQRQQRSQPYSKAGTKPQHSPTIRARHY